MARQRAVFPRDTGLQTRMLLTMFLLGLLYVALIGALLAAGTGLVLMVVIIAGLSFAQLFFSDTLALAAMGAKEVSPQDAPGLHAIIERLCIQAALPKPRIAMADTHVPNAFACGRSQKSATVCATTGIMSVLSPSELEGVMTHELAHVKHRDVLIMTIASFFASIAAMIMQFGFFFGGDDEDRKSTRLNSSHANISYAVFCLKTKNNADSVLISTMPNLPKGAQIRSPHARTALTTTSRVPTSA